MKKYILWSIKDFVYLIKQRQKNEFDANIGVSGPRGNGKSTFIFKTLSRVGGFKPWKHQVYSRDDVMKLLEGQKYGLVFDDEAVNSGYKRDFYDQGQKKLIKMVNMYRDNFNIYASAIPRFYSLDKDLRNLMKIHVNIVSRGVGIVHVANDNTLYSDDPWDVEYNKKVEMQWLKKKLKKIDAPFPYHKLTTFRGVIKFNKLGKNQELLYKKIKATKRKVIYEKELKGEEKEEEGKYEKLLKFVKDGKFTKESLMTYCLMNKLKYSSVSDLLNRLLVNKGDENRLSYYLQNPLLLTSNISNGKNPKTYKVPVV